jgi:hypothetical protein
MRHETKAALLAGATLIRKGDEDDPLGIVTKSLQDLQKTVDERLKKVEGGTELKAALGRGR